MGLDDGLPPLSLVTWRLVIAAATLVALLRLLGGGIPRDRAVLRDIALLGATNVTIPFVLITWGELSIPSAMASILNGLVPLFTIVFAAVVLRDEPMTANRLGGLLVGFVGAALILSRGLGAAVPASAAGPPLAGELAVVLAAAFYGASVVYLRHRIASRDVVVEAGTTPRRLNPVEIALPQVAAAAVLAAVLAAIAEWVPAGGIVLPPVPGAWLSVTWLGVLGSGVAYVLSFTLVTRWGATRATLVTYVFPIVGVVLGVAILGESIDLRVVAGVALVAAGIGLVNSRRTGRLLYGRAAARAEGRAGPGGRPEPVEIEEAGRSRTAPG